MLLVLLGFLVHGIYHVFHAPVNDMERSYLDLDHAEILAPGGGRSGAGGFGYTIRFNHLATLPTGAPR